MCLRKNPLLSRDNRGKGKSILSKLIANSIQVKNPPRRVRKVTYSLFTVLSRWVAVVEFPDFNKYKISLADKAFILPLL